MHAKSHIIILLKGKRRKKNNCVIIAFIVDNYSRIASFFCIEKIEENNDIVMGENKSH